MTAESSAAALPSARELEPAYEKAVGITAHRLSGECHVQITPSDDGCTVEVWHDLPDHGARELIRTECDGSIRQVVERTHESQRTVLWERTLSLGELAFGSPT